MLGLALGSGCCLARQSVLAENNTTDFSLTDAIVLMHRIRILVHVSIGHVSGQA